MDNRLGALRLGLVKWLLNAIYLDHFTGRLQGMLLEAKGCWEEAEKTYSNLLEENPLDQVGSLFVWLSNTLCFLLLFKRLNFFVE